MPLNQLSLPVMSGPTSLLLDQVASLQEATRPPGPPPNSGVIPAPNSELAPGGQDVASTLLGLGFPLAALQDPRLLLLLLGASGAGLGGPLGAGLGLNPSGSPTPGVSTTTGQTGFQQAGGGQFNFRS